MGEVRTPEKNSVLRYTLFCAAMFLSAQPRKLQFIFTVCESELFNIVSSELSELMQMTRS